jgi:hypothetical protein
MEQSDDLLGKMVVPYYAHCQARIMPALHSIAWNKVALAGYIDITILLKDLAPPIPYLRKIRAFYENYEQIETTHPLLGDLDALSRNLIHLDKENGKAVTAFALKWNNTVHALEEFCFALILQRKINGLTQIVETLQSLVFTAMSANTLPRWVDLLDQQQQELARMFQLKNLPGAALSKLNFRHQFNAGFQSDQQWLIHLMNDDKELQDVIHLLNKHFLRLVSLINEKVPEPERQVRVNPAKQVQASPSQDYRLAVTYFYDGNDEGEYHPNFFSMLRNFLK